MAPAAPAYVGRLAPSPTGHIHLGIARTSLAAWLDARAHDGRLLLRIEDIDGPRVVSGSADSILYDFEWLGLTWDERTVAQSSRFELYAQSLQRLGDMGRTFTCTCSRKEIARAASAPHGPTDEGPRYPGTCRQGHADKPGRNPAIRLRTEVGDLIQHHDRRLGPLDQDVHETVGDFVLKRTDDIWAYQLAVAVDDLEQGITCIVRGADLSASTPRQLLLRRLLDPNATQLSTLHAPMMSAPDGSRLAKRVGSESVAALRAAGMSKEELIGSLAAGLGLIPKGTPSAAEALVPIWRDKYLSSGTSTQKVF